MPQENSIIKKSDSPQTAREFDLYRTKAVLIVGGIITIFGVGLALGNLLFVVLTMAAGHIQYIHTQMVLVTLLLLAAGPAIFASQWRVFRDRSREQSILAAAEACQGKLTVADAALHGSMPLKDANAWLERFASLELCDVEMTDSGKLVYVFKSFLPVGQREAQTSKPISIEGPI
jgi:hypothetical protein